MSDNVKKELPKYQRIVYRLSLKVYMFIVTCTVEFLIKKSSCSQITLKHLVYKPQIIFA